MIMSKFYTCCEKCLQTIGTINTPAAKTWMDLCQIGNIKGFTEVKFYDCHQFQILERHGFLVSTEKEDGIAIRLNGKCHTNDGLDLFCIKGGCHD